jgi:hypothetical protein
VVSRGQPGGLPLPVGHRAKRREPNMDLYQHVRVVVSILVGFSLTHLLKGAARLVQHPGRERVYWVHLVWVLFIFFYVITFWWWEFRLEEIPGWTFPIYVFVIVYGILLYLLCALLFEGVRRIQGLLLFAQEMVLWGDGRDVGNRCLRLCYQGANASPRAWT